MPHFLQTRGLPALLSLLFAGAAAMSQVAPTPAPPPETPAEAPPAKPKAGDKPTDVAPGGGR